MGYQARCYSWGAGDFGYCLLSLVVWMFDDVELWVLSLQVGKLDIGNIRLIDVDVLCFPHLVDGRWLYSRLV